MTEILNAVRGAITLDIPALMRFRQSENVFRRGVTILVLVALIVGAVAFLVDFIGGLIRPPFATEMAEIQSGIEQWFQFMPAEGAEEFRQLFLPVLEDVLEIIGDVAALPTRLPRALTVFFHALGRWVNRPLAMLGGFLGYGIWVMLAAKLLGGRGRLPEFLGTAALSSVPYLLLVLERVPCLGGILSLVAWVWGTIIWVVATAVTHGWAVPQTTEEGAVTRYEVAWGKPILAVLLPALAVAVLVLIGGISLLLIILSAIQRAGG